MEENEMTFVEEQTKISTRTLNFYGTQQRENKSRIYLSNGSPFLIRPKLEKYKTENVFHVCFQLSSIVDYVSNNKDNLII